jgi:hypothetical protein
MVVPAGMPLPVMHAPTSAAVNAAVAEVRLVVPFSTPSVTVRVGVLLVGALMVSVILTLVGTDAAVQTDEQLSTGGIFGSRS